MTWPMYDALAELCDTLEGDASVRVVVLRGAGGKAFIAGTDIGQFRTFRTEEDGIEYERRLDAVVNRLEAVAKPTIAAIDGATTGGGLRHRRRPATFASALRGRASGYPSPAPSATVSRRPSMPSSSISSAPRA